MRKCNICEMLLCITLAFCLYDAPTANAASAEEEILQVMSNFPKAFNNADFELMSSLYWHSPKTSSFSPAKESPFLTQGWDALEIWWKNFLGLPKGTFSSSFHNLQVTMLGDNIAIGTCYQILTINPPVRKEQTIDQSRVTLVFQKIDGKWLVIHDHGSGFPTE